MDDKLHLLLGGRDGGEKGPMSSRSQARKVGGFGLGVVMCWLAILKLVGLLGFGQMSGNEGAGKHWNGGSWKWSEVSLT